MFAMFGAAMVVYGATLGTATALGVCSAPGTEALAAVIPPGTDRNAAGLGSRFPCLAMVSTISAPSLTRQTPHVAAFWSVTLRHDPGPNTTRQPCDVRRKVKRLHEIIPRS
jgi:hypothetical protein